MGYPVDESEAGLLCRICWGLGKPFGNVHTPKRLYMTASGFVPPVDGANGVFILTQDPVLPCYWDGPKGDYIGYFEFDAMNSLCEIKKGAVSIFQAVDVPCTLSFDQGLRHVVIH